MSHIQHHKNYYDILNVKPNVEAMDIIKAYREVMLIFQPDSLATYSLYSKEQLEDILLQIEEAYFILSDIEKRQEYDKRMNIPAVSEANNETST